MKIEFLPKYGDKRLTNCAEASSRAIRWRSAIYSINFDPLGKSTSNLNALYMRKVRRLFGWTANLFILAGFQPLFFNIEKDFWAPKIPPIFIPFIVGRVWKIIFSSLGKFGRRLIFSGGPFYRVNWIPAKRACFRRCSCMRIFSKVWKSLIKFLHAKTSNFVFFR